MSECCNIWMPYVAAYYEQLVGNIQFKGTGYQTADIDIT